MSYVKFDTPSQSNKESVSGFVKYMSKEDEMKGFDKEFWFNDREDLIPDYRVIDEIDQNQKGIAKDQFRYYTGSISFSEAEIAFLKNDSKKFKKYTQEVFKAYAENFKKDLNVSDIRFFAKLETNRYYKGNDEEVRKGLVRSGDVKPGTNTHLHFIVGRKSMDNRFKLSPITNHLNSSSGAVKGGFNRDRFKEVCEQRFDQMFQYNRPIEDCYRHINNSKDFSKKDSKNGIADIAERSGRLGNYDKLSDEQKHKKIETLSNYIQHGIDKSGQYAINTKRLLDEARANAFNGDIYKSLLNLNFKLKSGFKPEGNDLTDYVSNYAKFINAPYPALPNNLKEDRISRYVRHLNLRLPDSNKLDIIKVLKLESSAGYNGTTVKALNKLKFAMGKQQQIPFNANDFVEKHFKLSAFNKGSALNTGMNQQMNMELPLGNIKVPGSKFFWGDDYHGVEDFNFKKKKKPKKQENQQSRGHSL